MYKQCITDHSAQRQRLLEQGLLDAMLRKPYEDISVQELCAGLGIPRKSFYRYFSGKDGALQSLMDHVLMDYEIYTSQDHIRSVSVLEATKLIFSYWQERQDVLDALVRNDLSGLLVQRATRRAKEQHTYPDKNIAPELQPYAGYMSDFLVSGILTMVIQWHANGHRESIDQMAQITMNLMTKPMFQNVNR